MDEKGFMIGVLGRQKRVFSKQLWQRGKVKEALQDGSREWITILASVCADGTTLPPSIIFAAASGSIQSPWVALINANDHDVFVTATESRWTNNEVGLA